MVAGGRRSGLGTGVQCQASARSSAKPREAGNCNTWRPWQGIHSRCDEDYPYAGTPQATGRPTSHLPELPTHPACPVPNDWAASFGPTHHLGIPPSAKDRGPPPGPTGRRKRNPARPRAAPLGVRGRRRGNLRPSPLVDSNPPLQARPLRRHPGRTSRPLQRQRSGFSLVPALRRAHSGLRGPSHLPREAPRLHQL